MSNVLQLLTDRYADLTEREKLLLKVGALIVPLMVLTLVGLFVNRSFNSIESNISRYEKVIDLLNQVGPRLRQSRAQSEGDSMSEKFSRKAIKNNEIGMTSFVSTQAAAAGVQVDSYNENKQPKNTGEGEEGTLMKIELEVQINRVELKKLMTLMERIETSGKPVFIERVRLTRRRREKGKLRAKLIVSTYKRKAES